MDESDELSLSARDKAAVINKIRTLMEYWAITPEELEQPLEYVPAPAFTALPTIKYRHPQSGETWDGSGTHPQWLRDALLKEGFTVEQLKAAVAESEPRA
jgi:DNA-binding protein H-NS